MLSFRNSVCYLSESSPMGIWMGAMKSSGKTLISTANEATIIGLPLTNRAMLNHMGRYIKWIQQHKQNNTMVDKTMDIFHGLECGLHDKLGQQKLSHVDIQPFTRLSVSPYNVMENKHAAVLLLQILGNCTWKCEKYEHIEAGTRWPLLW